MKNRGDYNSITQDCLQNMAGFYGEDWVADTNTHTLKVMGYKAKTDTVIASLTNDTVNIGVVLGSAALTLKAGDELWFGFVANSYALTSGTGWFYLAEERTVTAPLLKGLSTNAAGTEVIMDLTQIMANPAALAASFILTVNDEVAAVTSVALDTDTTDIVIAPTTPLVNGDVASLTIATKIIMSAAGVYFLGCTDYPVTNIVPET